MKGLSMSRIKLPLLVLISLFLLTPQTARAELPTTAWYNSRQSLQMPFYGNNGNLSVNNFSVMQEGLYTLNGDQFETTYQGLVQLSGTCYNVKPTGQYLTAHLPQSGRSYPLAWNVVNVTYSFSVAFPAYAEPVVLSFTGTSQFNETYCNILFQAVG